MVFYQYRDFRILSETWLQVLYIIVRTYRQSPKRQKCSSRPRGELRLIWVNRNGCEVCVEFRLSLDYARRDGELVAVRVRCLCVCVCVRGQTALARFHNADLATAHYYGSFKNILEHVCTYVQLVRSTCQ